MTRYMGMERDCVMRSFIIFFLISKYLQILMGKPEGKTRFGRTMPEWEADIKNGSSVNKMGIFIWLRIGTCDGLL